MAASSTVRPDAASPARRVTTAAVGALVLAALVAGGGVFTLMWQLHQSSVEGELAGALQDRRGLVESQFQLHESRAEDVAQVDELRDAIGRRRAEALEPAIRGAVIDEVRAVTVLSGAGAILAVAGTPVQAPALAFQLSTPLASELLWDGRPMLRTRVPVRRDGRTLGVVVVEQTMNVLGAMLKAEVGIWKSGEIALCFAQDARLHCLPQRRNTRVHEAPLRGVNGTPLPAALAADGRSGIARAPDSLGYEVVASYGPVGQSGLLMAVEVDADEIAAPLLRQLPVVVLLAIGAIALGMWLLRRNVQPLVAQLAAAQAQTAAARDRLQKIADNIPALVGYVDAEERYQFANRTYDLWFGKAHDAILGKRVAEVWDEARYAQSAPFSRRALAGERVEFQRTLVNDGKERTLRTAYVPDTGADGRVAGFFILSSDVTEQAEARKALDHALKRLDLALDAARVTVWEADLRSGEVVLSEAWAELLGRAPGETRTTVAELSALVHPSELGLLNRMSTEAIRGERSEYAVEHRVRAEGGEWKWILSRGRVVERDPASGRALRLMGTNLDITGRKLGELRLEQLANYDELTGAANRNLFGDRLAQAILRCRRGGKGGALLYLDIDKFKGINDTLGHAAGDALLKEFAARIKACVRATDTVGRLGGDEFAVLLEDVAREGAGQVAGKILAAMRAPVALEGREVVITTSIGVAPFGGDAEAEALARAADAALYEAKAAGRNCFRVSPGA